MSTKELTTHAVNQWCPGCGNFGILNSVQAVLQELKAEGFPLEKLVMVTGIGNHGKLADYVNINSFYSIHGRTFPAATAIKLADPELKVMCFAGDGDAYAEGLDHLVFAAKRNIDLTAIIHDNRAYALATGQFTPTTPHDYKGTTTPYGSKEVPINPLELMLASGATFIGRGYPVRQKHFQGLLKAAIMHKGFALIDVLQVCVTYNNLYEFYNKMVYEAEVSDPTSFEEAQKVIRSWDYDTEGPIAIGRFYQVDRPGFEDCFPRIGALPVDREAKLRDVLERFI